MHPRREDRCPEEQLHDEAHDGVLCRAELRARGWDRDAVARQVRTRRWALHGHQTVALHTTVLSLEANLWRAWWEVGSRVAALDGVTALQSAGLVGYHDDVIHVSVPHTASVVAPPGVRVHKVARRVEGELHGMPRRRTVPAIAAVRAAHWAVSDRQAALTLVMPVQQRLITGQQLVHAAKAVRGRTRRAFIHAVAKDIADGAQSLGELDFALMCRRRGLPEPTRQAVRTAGAARAYLDVAWEDIGLVVEIDGSQHQWGAASTDDQFRQNALVISGDRVLRMTLLGLRLAPDRFMDQVCTAYWSLKRANPRRSR
jgi:very-short-patch-repair endonuclease